MRHIGALALVLCVAGVLATPFHASGGWLFAPPFPVPVGVDPTSVEVVDLNADGILDLAVTNGGSNPDNLCSLLGNGDGTFQSPVYFPTGQWPTKVSSGLFNDDEHVDLVVANYETDDISVLLGNGDGTFQPTVYYGAGDGPTFVEVGLLDDDSFQDLAVANNVSNDVSILLGNGDGTFQGAASYPAGAGSFTLAVGDFDGNGDLDLATANTNGGDISVLLGNGDGSFQAPVTYVSGTEPRKVVAMDLDGDTFQDLVVSNAGSDNVAIFLGNGNGTFDDPAFYGTDDPFNVTVGEFNGDNIPDIATANWAPGTCSVLLGNGDGTFQVRVNYATGNACRSVDAGDLNGDGNQDLAFVNHDDDNVTVLLNRSPAEPQIVSVADIGNDQGGQVRLEWLASGSDMPGSTVTVTSYAIFRRQDGYLTRGSRPAERTSKCATGEGGDRLDGWDYIATVPAFGDPSYQCIVSTLCDSTELGGVCWSVFMVRTATEDPFLYADSAPDSGYSIDNLAPEAPATLRGEFDVSSGSVALSWPPCSSADAQYYELCRGEGPGFVPSIANRIYADTDTVFVDASAEWSGSTYYKVAAVDFGGNRSEYSSISALATGIPDGELPRSFTIHPARPNPFKPRTSIAFDLPEAAAVSLSVYDASGRLVRRLLDRVPKGPGHHAELWDGRDDAGRRAASGVYFYRVDVGSEAVTSRMVLLR